MTKKYVVALLAIATVACGQQTGQQTQTNEPVAQIAQPLNTQPVYQDPGATQIIAQPPDSGLYVNRLNETRFADQFDGGAGASAARKIAAAISDLPATGGVVDARGLIGTQTLDADMFGGTTKPGHLLLGETIFSVTATQNVPSNWSIDGVRGGRIDGGGITGGTVFRAGAANIAILKYFNSEFTKTSGVNIDGNAQTGVTGILVDSNVTNDAGAIPASHHNDYEYLHIENVAVGIQFGTRGTLDDEVDSWSVRHFSIVRVSDAGIRINSQNASQTSIIEHGFFGYPSTTTMSSIDFQLAALNLSIRNIAFAAGAGYAGAALNLRYVNSGGSALYVEECSFELPSGYAVVAPTGSDDLKGTLVFIGNQFQQAGIYIAGARNIVSIGNHFDSYPSVSNSTSSVTTIHDVFDGQKWQVSKGVGTGSSANGYGLPGDLSVGRSATTGALFLSTGTLASLDYGLNVPGAFYFTGGPVGMGSGMYNDSAGFKHKRNVATGSIAAGASAAVSVNWATPFADNNYTATCTLTETTVGRTLQLDKIESQLAGSVSVRVFNSDTSSRSGTVGCVAVHD